MRWVRRAGWLLLGALALYGGFFAVCGLMSRYPLAGPAGGHQGVRGAYHLHSTLSDGRGSPEEIAAAAKSAGLDFVVLTDHNVAALAPARWVDGVLVITAQELSTPAGHLVALGASRALTADEREHDPVSHVNALGGAGFLAHPLQRKRPWTDWEAATRAAGLELYSADSMFRTAWSSPFTLLGPALFGYLGEPRHGLLTVFEPQAEVSERMLALSGTSPKVALCAHDAHGLPPYLTEFNTMSMYLPWAGPNAVTSLNADGAAAEHQVIAALKSGESYCAVHVLAEGSGFALGGVGPRRTVHPGDVLSVQLPLERPATATLRVGGSAHLGPDGWSVVADGPGALQVEVWVRVPNLYVGSGWRPWLVPSPVRVETAR
jgi:hypothetical protein